ncbi:MAG: hypothetical protein U1E16_04555 [Hyphomicrobiales bacterium]
MPRLPILGDAREALDLIAGVTEKKGKAAASFDMGEPDALRAMLTEFSR